MTLPPLEQQQRIGKLDERRRHLKYLQAKRTYLMDQFYQNIYLRRAFRCQQQKTKTTTSRITKEIMEYCE